MTSPFNRRGDVSWADPDGTALLSPDGSIAYLAGGMPGGFATGPASAQSMVLLGDSRLVGGLSGTAAKVKTILCWTTWANAFLGQAFDIVANYAVSGERSDEYLARLSQAMAHRPGWLVLWGVVNDISQGRTPLGAGAFWPAIAAAVRAAVARGTRVVLCGETGSYGFSATQAGYVLQYNQLSRELARAVPGVYFLDFPVVTWDLSQSAITHRSGFASDSTHFSSAGAHAQGVLAAEVLRPHVSVTPYLLQGAVDAGSNGLMQYLPNAAFVSATGGTVVANASGAVPSGWSVGGSVPAVPVVSSVSGREWQVEVTSTGAGHVNQSFTFAPAGSAGNYPTPAAGEIHQAGGRVVISPGASGYIGPELHLFMQVGGENYTVYDFLSANTHPALNFSGTVILDLMTPPFVVPAGSVTGWQFFVRNRFNGAGGATVKLVGPWYRRLLAS